MTNLLRWEWVKLSRRLPPWLPFAALALLIGLLTHGVSRHHHARLDTGDLEVVGDVRNGLFMAFITARTVSLLVLYLAPVVVGELLGSEGAGGTLRFLLVRPLSRGKLWCAKVLTAAGYTVGLCGFTFAASLLAGTLCFGWGRLVLTPEHGGGKLLVLTPPEALGYLALSYALLALAVFVTGALALALAGWLDNALAPGFVALSVLITLQIVSGLDLPWLEQVNPYLFTNYLAQYQKVFPTDFHADSGALVFPGAALWPAVRVLGAWAGAFLVVSWRRFVTRDVTC